MTSCGLVEPTNPVGVIEGGPKIRATSARALLGRTGPCKRMCVAAHGSQNGFSRKPENHAAAVSLQYFVYNFMRIHRTLRVTPAMAAGVTGRLGEVSNIIARLEEAKPQLAALVEGTHALLRQAGTHARNDGCAALGWLSLQPVANILKGPDFRSCGSPG